MVLTEKRDEIVKGRAVADGRKQHDYRKKEYASSPTVSLEAILITSAISAHEQRDVATIGIHGAYLHTDTDEDVIMQLKGKLSKLIVAVKPKLYIKYVMFDGKG